MRSCFSDRPVKSSSQKVIVPHSEYLRIKTAAVVLSREARLKQQLNYIAEKEAQQQEYQKLFVPSEIAGRTAKNEKEHLQTDESKRIENEKLKKKLEHLRQEQEDDIRKLNEMIAEVKCLAVREEQIHEKERRLKAAKLAEMEIDQKVEKQQDELREQRLKRQKHGRLSPVGYTEVLKKQIEENAKNKHTARERFKEWEATEIQKKVVEFKAHQLEEKMRKLEMQRKLQEDLQKGVQEKLRLKNQEKEEEFRKLEMLKRHRLERQLFEDSVKEEKERREKLRQAKTAYIANLRSIDLKGSQQHLNCLVERRARERVEQDWRKKELENMHKLTEEKDVIRRAWQSQVEERKRLKTEMERKRQQEHEELIRADHLASERFKKLEEKRTREREAYVNDIKQQIRQNEKLQQISKKARAEDAEEAKKAVDERKQLLQNIKIRKLRELRDMQLPEKYIKEVARKSKTPWDTLRDPPATQVKPTKHKSSQVE